MHTIASLWNSSGKAEAAVVSKVPTWFVIAIIGIPAEVTRFSGALLTLVLLAVILEGVCESLFGEGKVRNYSVVIVLLVGAVALGYGIFGLPTIIDGTLQWLGLILPMAFIAVVSLALIYRDESQETIEASNRAWKYAILAILVAAIVIWAIDKRFF